MKTPGFTGAIVAVFGAILVQASGAELTRNDKQAMLQLKELTKKYSEYCFPADKPMPASFGEFLSPAELKAINASGSDAAPAQPQFELLKPAPKVSNVVNPARTPLILSTVRNTAGQRLIAFVDGHVEFVSDSDLETLRSDQRKSPQPAGQGLVK